MTNENSSWYEQYKTLEEEGLSHRAISAIMNVPKSTLWDRVKVIRSVEGVTATKQGMRVKQQQMIDLVTPDNWEDNSVVLVISDMHIPYHHPNMLDWLQSLKDKYKPTRVICIGDELDKHALSYHDSDPNLKSAGDELSESLVVIEKLHEMFPLMDILESNHGSLIYRKAKTHGIPKQYLKSYNDVLGVNSGWKWHFDLTITLPNGSPVYFHHGKSSDGLRLSQTMGMSCVQGHFHEKFKIDYWANPLGLYWAMQVGCLIDDDSLAFAYNNVNLKRPIIGCGLIVDSVPVLEAMPL